MKSCRKRSAWMTACTLALLLGGCFRGQESTFRVTVKTGDSEKGAPTALPPLASHTSGTTGEVTPYLPPAVSPQVPHPEKESGPPPASQDLAAEHRGPETAASGPPSRPPANTTVPPFAAELSAAVALPMTGPEGTMMGFSVDYQFRGGELPAGAFVWVIEGAQGRQYRVAVKLESRGNLMLVVPGWRPEDGPFRCRLEDQSGRAISSTVEMR